MLLAFGNEASESDIREFAARFHCDVRDSYGSTEGLIIIRRDPSMPSGALGRAPDDTIAVYDPDTGEECPRARFDADGRLVNTEDAVGEIVNTTPGDGFEGYYRNEEAPRLEGTGRHLLVRRPCLPRRRRMVLLRRPLQRVAARRRRELRRRARRAHRARVIRRCAPPRSMPSPTTRSVTASWWRSRSTTSTRSTSRRFDEFLLAQRDLGPKWVPRFVRRRCGAAQARQHEDRQDAAPPRRLDRTGRLVATRPGGTAPAFDADRPRGPGPPASVNASAPSLRVATSERASATCAPEPSELRPSTWSPGAVLQW